MITRRFDPSSIQHLIIAGWTGRNQAALDAHIRELEELGLPRPARTPIFYRASASLLTDANEIQVVGDNTSGEVEFVIVKLDNSLWLGLGSDHTDRKLEITSVALSKQICAKVVASELWSLDDVLPHWDQLMLRSWTYRDGARALYQEGPVTTMRDPRELIALYEAESGTLPTGAAMFCGTLATIGKISPADELELELQDPALGRSLRHRYRITALPLV